MVNRDPNSSVIFHINGEKHIVNGAGDINARTVLADYIRDVANLKGTKVMCREGGCGACIVTAKVPDPITGSEVTKSVNSCLTPVFSCDGWDISTVESLGNKHEGYSVMQNRLVNFHGSQCGYCTPGMVMSMNSLLGANKDLGMEDVEKSLDGNLCRCTGYRPIVEAFKSLAHDASSDLQQKCADIEDCASCPLKKANARCENHAKLSSLVALKCRSGEQWLTAKSLEGALAAASTAQNSNALTYRFVAGNTSTGIFKNEGPYQLFIDINGIPELKKSQIGNKEVIIGGGTCLTETIQLLREAAELPGFEYGKRVASHLERVANTSVRNNGTVAGNLMIKHGHNEFPSDVFVLLEGIGATITIASSKIKKNLLGGSDRFILDDPKTMSLTEFLKTDMKAKLIVSVNLPKREGFHFRSFKITRRYHNAHAYVNAALLLKVNKSAGFTVEEQPRICYGGISPSFIHASGAEAILTGKRLTDVKTINEALQTLEKEVKPDDSPLESSPDYRLHLTKTLLYKTILEIIGDKTSDKVRSGGIDIVRNLHTSKQVFEGSTTDTTLYKAVPKSEAAVQASGEAEYTNDIPIRSDELFGAFVTSTVACAELKSLDATEALKLPGVVRFVTAKDIPGENNATKFNFFPGGVPEPVFVADKVSYNGQSLGMILANSKELAVKAAKLVKVEYANVQKPVVHIEEAIEKAKAAGTFALQTAGTYSAKPTEGIKVIHTLKGHCRTGSQYHFYMETLTCVCHPREDGIDVYATSQWVDQCQNTIAIVLGIPTNSINMQVRRLGGGFGGKISRTTFVAAACAVSTWITKRPVRVVLDLDTNMSMFGKRLPYSIPYEVGFDENGRIGSLNIDLICDTGSSPNDATAFLAMMHCQNVYKAAGWEVGTHFVLTNTPSGTATRAPGSVQSVGAVEWIMEHIADYLKKDPMAVREANFLEIGDALLNPLGPPTFNHENLMPMLIKKMKENSDFESRMAIIERINKANRWKKRGMGVVPVRFGIDYFGTNIPASVAIYHLDGSVAVCHGGIEMGQGINTKVMQTVAHALQVPLDRIKTKPTNNFVAANSYPTAASIGSELVCYSVMRACEELRENLRPILEKLENPSWEKLIEEAHTAKVNLTASYLPTAKDDIKGYDVWVLNATEVEIDVLTGEYKIIRTDLYEDTGKSLSPAVDLGQIEGGYIMGQGYWTTENIIHDENTGKLLTNGTWDYKPPVAKDIPEDFRITLLNNTPNEHGILRSKATGEPSVDAAFGVVLAMRNAIASARADAGNTDWFEMPGPVTPEDIARLCLTKESHLTL